MPTCILCTYADVHTFDLLYRLGSWQSCMLATEAATTALVSSSLCITGLVGMMRCTGRRTWAGDRMQSAPVSRWTGVARARLIRSRIRDWL